MTVKSFIDGATQRVAQIYPEQEAKNIVLRLVEHFLSIPNYKIYSEPKMAIKPEKVLELNSALEEICKKRPLQYVLGYTEFAQLKIRVKEGVLIPRPETEELVYKIVEEFEDGSSEINILDVCTGSGCIAYALADAIPEAMVYGCDISDDALKVACKQRVKIAGSRPIFFWADALSQPPAGIPKFDIIVSNPPYVRFSEAELMDENVLKYEPSIALFVKDEEPLLYYKSIALWAKQLLKKGGKLYFEINEAFGLEVTQMLEQEGFVNIKLSKDINSKDRFVSAQI